MTYGRLMPGSALSGGFRVAWDYRILSTVGGDGLVIMVLGARHRSVICS
jgi:hypothetical protein